MLEEYDFLFRIWENLRGDARRIMLEDLRRNLRGMCGKKIARRFGEISRLGEECSGHIRKTVR